MKMKCETYANKQQNYILEVNPNNGRQGELLVFLSKIKIKILAWCHHHVALPRVDCDFVSI